MGRKGVGGRRAVWRNGHETGSGKPGRNKAVSAGNAAEIEPETASPVPSKPEQAAPKTAPAPPAPQMASNGPDSWEGRVLAALNKQRRYPRTAQFRRQQGVPYIRFVMNREGKVLSSRLERSSGFPDLDREALALPKRAQPLPKPPKDRPGETLELVVPVEFLLH
ncbi:energy transducer TonB family protein [Novosphingobium beihaiensis]|uniref:TonB family protein n=1 Tax=Novosphingobium beihaiensis TaxID=2930389 RepID=A0ABT0BT88_9SPHN|nr:TonB family protein [Novosphingobium beihaiensis]MCJ2188277.1 TonB family protein [Novosphingobium beihaiensis]